MPPIFSCSPLSIPHQPFSSSRCKSHLWDKKNLDDFRPQQGTLLLFTSRPRATQSHRSLTPKRNCRLPITDEVELLHWVEKDEILSTDDEIDLASSVDENGHLGTNIEGNGVTTSSEKSGERLCVKKIARFPVKERGELLHLDKYVTISEYNDILAALSKAGAFDTAVKLFSELPSQGLTPDVWSFSIMIRCLCKKNEPDEAKELLDEMVRRGLHPSVSTFNFLVNCLCKRGKLRKTFEVFEIMKGVGCEPTTRTYNYLIGGLCYVGRVEEAFDLLQKMKKSPKAPDIYTFTLVIDGFCKVGRSDEAMELLKEAMEMELTPTIVTYNALLNGYCKEGRPLEGLRIFKEMEGEMEGRGCKPDSISYSTLLPGLLQWREISSALEIYKKMVAAGFPVKERVMNTLLRGLCKKSMTKGVPLEEVEELFKKVIEMGHSVYPYTYCLMVQALAKGGETDKALAHLFAMIRSGCSPRLLSYNVVLRVLCADERLDDALHVFILMIKGDVIPSSFTVSILIDGFSRQQRMLDALGVYATAVKRGVVPHRKLRKDWMTEKLHSFETREH